MRASILMRIISFSFVLSAFLREAYDDQQEEDEVLDVNVESSRVANKQIVNFKNLYFVDEATGIFLKNISKNCLNFLNLNFLFVSYLMFR